MRLDALEQMKLHCDIAIHMLTEARPQVFHSLCIPRLRCRAVGSTRASLMGEGWSWAVGSARASLMGEG